MVLRQYQSDAMESIYQQLETNSRTLAVLPTGCGKTVIFGFVAKAWQRGRVLVMAHRDELIRQAADKIERITGEPCDIEMADEYADSELLNKAKVVVTSVQTMCRERRHRRFSPIDFGLLVIDEAHHAVAQTYQTVIQHFAQNANLKILGVTATPDRSDELALGQIFQSVAYEYGIVDAIHDGWLVPIEQQFVYVEGLDFSGIKTTAGDLNAGQLATVMEREEMLHKVVSPVLQVAQGRKTLVFAASVAHAEMMAEIANRHESGCADIIHGGTNKETRREILKRYADGEVRYLFNCAIATEGFDDPGIEVVAIARPTKSRSLYSQQVGRGTRPLPNTVDGLATAEERTAAIARSAKPSVTILDFVGNSGRHKLVNTADILGGKYPDEVVARVMKRREKSQRPFDVMEELEEASKELEEEARRKRRALVATAKFGTRAVNPFNVLDITPQREPGWHKGRMATENQKAALKRMGIADVESMTFVGASQLISVARERREKGLCSFKQAKLLAKYGYEADVTFEKAREIIDSLAANNWQRVTA